MGKILFLSPTLDPQAVGETRISFDIASALAEKAELLIITQTPPNRSFKVRDLFPNSEVIEFPPLDFTFLPARLNALVKPNYFKFMWDAEKAIRDRVVEGDIVCAHHFGPTALRYPSPLRKHPIPYIIGPLGGSLPTPKSLAVGKSSYPWYYSLRNADALRFRVDPWLRSTYENASCLVGVAPYVEKVLSGINLKRFVSCPEVAAPSSVDDIDAVIDKRYSRSGATNYLVVSRLVHSKGVHAAIDAAARVKEKVQSFRLDILGDGPERSNLEQRVIDFGLEEYVRFHGHVPRSEVDAFYRNADVFLFPSFREPSGVVVFEAMSWGLPIVAADYGGPEASVTDEIGMKCRIESYKTFTDDLTHAMLELASNPEIRSQKGQASLRSAITTHSMRSRVEFFCNLYRQISSVS
ncbi:MAG: glycosyltransferase family 4 protein [Pseudomonadota bacterium]